jgi:PAS domain S-box-containing protein
MENGKITLLLVEDEALIGMTEKLQLKSYGYDVIHVLSGEKAFETINGDKSSIDLILMDINLGQGIDGPEAATRILKEHDIPVVFLSSHIEREIVDRTAEITSYGYVLKNSNIAILDASIKMALRLHLAYLDLKNQKSETDNKKSELQFYETRYRRLFESAQDGILIINAQSGLIIDVNPFLVGLLGYSKDQFLRKKLWDISAFKNIDYSKQLFKELQENEYIRYIDLPLESAGHKIIHVEFVSNVYLVDGEKVIQCNIRDIESRLQHERELTSDIDRKNTFLRELQHRTKNSFSMITSLIGIRAQSSSSPGTKEALEELSLRVQSISDLYSLLYETDSFFEVSLKTYCNTVIDSMLSISSNITFVRNLEEVTVTPKSAASIGMIIVELLSNSIKYAFPDNARGTISLGIKQIEGEIQILIIDDGIGFEAKGDAACSDSDSIGLHIVSLLIEQLDGTIHFSQSNGTWIEIRIKNEPPRVESAGVQQIAH